MSGSSGRTKVKAPQYAALYPNENGGKIPYYSKIGTKLIVGFLIIASITGTVGYLSLNYSQTVGEKFHLLVQQTLPAVDSLKESKVAALTIETDTNAYVFTPVVDKDKFLQELTDQKSNFNESMKRYEVFINSEK